VFDQQNDDQHMMDINTFFELDSTGRTRGHCLKLKKGRVSTDLRQHFFGERIVNIWNRLKPSIVESSINQSINQSIKPLTLK